MNDEVTRRVNTNLARAIELSKQGNYPEALSLVEVILADIDYILNNEEYSDIREVTKDFRTRLYTIRAKIINKLENPRG